MSTTEDNEKAVRDCFENAARGNFDALDGIVTPDYLLHPDEARGAEGLKEVVQQYRDALADLHVSIDQQFSSGDCVATRITISGRHEGDLMGTPATGNEVSFSGLTISRCEGGRIAEEWELVDMVSLLGQVGALPAMAQG
jgi:predicted ester cyclase